ncbi:T9SS type A sorting domain-containing protein [Chryseobacterium ginsenosidimutans]|uniref:T9SS type A sorting domain-containing protein n=1 Tax=Chryseobacterium ginsenosidimutans TaxID=687846 RepID=UPI0031D3D473
MLLLIPISLLKAQSAVLATGADATGSNGSVSYSVGQAAYLVKGSSRQVSEGVQQVYEITTLATSEISNSTEEGILLYPNPFKDYLYLDFTTNNFKGSEYQLFDAQGKLIKTDKISQSKSEFNFSYLPSAMYIIRINQEGKNIKTFKIIKK